MEKLTPGKRLKELRLKEGWTLEKLADKLEKGASLRRVSDWENGRVNISLNFARQLSKVFKVGVETFL